MSVVLVVSGLDPSGGAGLLADVQTVRHFGRWPVGVATTLTVQDTRGLVANHPVDADIVRAQLGTLFSDLDIAAVKVGALGSEAVVNVIADFMREHDTVAWVVDPVFRSTSSGVLLDAPGRRAFVDNVLPRASVVTPNAGEAAALLCGGSDANRGDVPTTQAAARVAAQAIQRMGPRAVLVTGGHLHGPDQGWDILATANEVSAFGPGGSGEARSAQGAHGTGCALSSAIAAQLAVGMDISEAVRAAKLWVFATLRSSIAVGGGSPVVNLAAPVEGKL